MGIAMADALRILMASATPPDPDSGAAGTELQTMRALQARGHRVDALWRGDLRQRIRHGNLHYLLELPWAYEEAIAARCRTCAYDVIHVNQPYAWRAAKRHQQARSPGVFVNRSHGWEPRIARSLAPWRKKYAVPDWRFPRGIVGRPMRYGLHRYAAWAARYADGIIVSCSEDRAYILSHYGLSEDRVACIPQAPPPSCMQRPPVAMTADRMRRIVYVGQSGFFKGPHVLAAVFSLLAAAHADCDFTWCTPAFEHERCRNLLAASVRDRVRFVDWLAQDALLDLYDRHGVFLFTTLSEGFGKVFLEAMARGLCVVASNTSGMRDVLRHRQNGCLVEVGDVQGFCEEVNWLLGDGDRMRRVADAAMLDAAGYSWARVADESVRFYERLLARKRVDGGGRR
jgi:glycosyltransferase involved in cell wall biosynthesis